MAFTSGARRRPTISFPLLIALAALGLVAGWLMPADLLGNRAIELEASLALLVVAVTGQVAFGTPRVTHADDDKLAPLIALVGCDGSGKSTLAADLLEQLRKERPIELCYLGLKSGDLGNRIRQLPLIGPRLEELLSKKAGQTRTKGERIPGLPTALVVFGFSLLRRRRFRRMLALRRQGVAVITDRYPQVEVSGFFDGPGLSAARADNWLVAWLAARELKMYEWMASFKPSIVIRLNIDAATAFARKPDHELALLLAKVEVTPLLRFSGAAIVDLDSRAPYADVRRSALKTAMAAAMPEHRLAA